MDSIEKDLQVELEADAARAEEEAEAAEEEERRTLLGETAPPAAEEAGEDAVLSSPPPGGDAASGQCAGQCIGGSADAGDAFSPSPLANGTHTPPGVLNTPPGAVRRNRATHGAGQSAAAQEALRAWPTGSSMCADASTARVDGTAMHAAGGGGVWGTGPSPGRCGVWDDTVSPGASDLWNEWGAQCARGVFSPAQPLGEMHHREMHQMAHAASHQMGTPVMGAPGVGGWWAHPNMTAMGGNIAMGQMVDGLMGSGMADAAPHAMQQVQRDPAVCLLAPSSVQLRLGVCGGDVRLAALPVQL